MKPIIQFLTISIFLLSVQFSFGQIKTSTKNNQKPYIVWVKTLDKTSTPKGYLIEVGDTLVIAPLILHKPIKKIRLDNVNYLEVREKGKAGKSTFLGGLVGFGVGALIGYIKPPPPCSSAFFCLDRGSMALIYGQIGAIPGLIIGNTIGRKKIKVPIHGSKKSIQAQKEELRKYKFGG